MDSDRDGSRFGEHILNRTIVIVIVLLVAAAAAWFFVSPLFIDETVDETLEFETPLPRSVVDATKGAPEEDLQAQIMAEAAAEPDTMIDDTMPAMDAPKVISRGAFKDADAVHKGSGDAIIYRAPDGSHLLRFENFRVTNGPALVVYLAKHANPMSADDVADGGFVDLGKLKGNVGNQNYPIPDTVNLGEYGSAVIWCELFGVLFSPAALAPPTD